jgi:hypothetical protein
MHAGHTANDGPIPHFHMPSQARQAGHDHMITQDTVMRYMHLRHNKIVRSQAGTATGLHTPVDDD